MANSRTPSDVATAGSASSGPLPVRTSSSHASYAANGGRKASGIASLTEKNLRAHDRYTNQTTRSASDTSYSIRRWLTGTDDTFAQPSEESGWAELVARDELAAQIDAAIKHMDERK